MNLVHLVFGFLSWKVTTCIAEMPPASNDLGRRALVLGGTQFMGRWTVDRLVSDGYAVTVFNRGVTPYPWPESRVKRLVADRMENRKKFRKVLKKSGDWDVIVDFTGFHEQFMQDTVESLRKPKTASQQGGFSVRHYVYISTDSVYWALKLPDDDARLNESSPTEFTREEIQGHQDYLKQTKTGQYQIKYGGNKLSCDVYLQKMFAKEGFPFTSLRLPDVYGPHDNLGGFWEVAAAVRESKRLGAMLPAGRIRPRGSKSAIKNPNKHQVTWVFVADVIDAIMAVISKGRQSTHGREMPFGEIFNIAHEEAVSLKEISDLILDVAQHSPKLRSTFGKEGARLDYNEEASLPTTDFGALDISKAKEALGWQPMPMREAVQVALEWYFGDFGKSSKAQEL